MSGSRRDGTRSATARWGPSRARHPSHSAPGQTSVLYLTDAGVLSTSTGGYPATAHVRLATVVTGAATITSLSDDRVVCSVVGTDALPYLPLAGGVLNDGANLALGTVAGTQIGTSTTQKLGFWNAPPVARPGPYTQGYAVSSKTLAAYTPIVEATAFSGIATGQAGLPYAQVARPEQPQGRPTRTCVSSPRTSPRCSTPCSTTSAPPA